MKVIRLIIESFWFAWNALKVNKLRTILSLMGVSIGIFVIILTYTFVDSLEDNFKNSFSFLGTNIININKWPYGTMGQEYKWWEYVNRPYPDYSDYQFLRENLESADGMSLYVIRGGQTYKSGNNSVGNSILNGVTYSYIDVFDFKINEGRYFSPLEAENGRNVAVIGRNISEGLFPNREAVGQDININGLKFKIVGLFEREGTSVLNSFSRDDMCMVPYRAFSRVYYSGARRGIGPTIAIKGKDDDIGLVELEGELTGLMRRKHSLKPRDKDDFALNRTQAIADAIGSLFDILGVVSTVLGGFSILVGGFGIANIMFVSVKERTNIIGIEKSLGAKNYFILFQFLFESIMLSLIGGLVGIILVYPWTLIPMGSLEVTLSAKNIIIGLAVSSLIGIASGIIPAALAARLDPVIAIRTTG